jgi:Cobalamin biosynthesis protein CobT (nicotinate-mononucleotide:5, 6-dimethylbenzimidazole phosphoribosyltransferase)
MKRFSLFILLFAALFFFAGCGGGGSDYDKYGDTDSDRNDNDTADTVPDKDSSDTADTAEDPTDTDTSEQSDNDGETTDEEETNDSDADSGESVDFWSTCEGIIACVNRCRENDSVCVGDCYGKGSDDAQLYYRRWIECFEDKCAEDKTPECSAANCAEWDELCNVASAFEYEVNIPAPYGNATFAGDFSFILNNVYPTKEDQIEFKSFASGNISSMSITPDGTIISFVRTNNDSRDGKVLEVYQAPYNVATQTSGNPVVLLRIKTSAATEGEHTAGVANESDARLIVGDIDSKYQFRCYHAFGIGSFKIDKAVVKTGSGGKLTFSNGSVELFNPQNIPELGGDAREILGVDSCSLIQ